MINAFDLEFPIVRGVVLNIELCEHHFFLIEN